MHIALIQLSLAKSYLSIMSSLDLFKQPFTIVTNVQDLQNCAAIIVEGMLGADVDLPAELTQALIEQHEAGVPILGVGAGAQLLLKYGLVPGTEDKQSCIQMHTADELKYENQIYLPQDFQLNAFTRGLRMKQHLQLTPASQGYFIIPPGLQYELKIQGLINFRYAKNHAAAGISNKSGNALALASPILDWKLIVKSMVEYSKIKPTQLIAPLSYYPRQYL